MLTIMQFASATKPPTKAEIEEAMKRSQAALPPQVPGPYAEALREIVRDLARQGKLDQAQEAEQRLEGVEAADPARADALTVIADAQLKADTSGAPSASATAVAGSVWVFEVLNVPAKMTMTETLLWKVTLSDTAAI